MDFPFFDNNDLMVVSDALDIAEDKTGNFYKFSLAQWKRHRYDIKTLASLDKNEVSDHAFAMLSKGMGKSNKFESKTKNHDYYLICLQDHQILKAVERDKNIDLLPLLVYTFTHELVHIVRFCNFHQRFDISDEDKAKEESIVHKATYEILRNLYLPKLDFVLDSYLGHRIDGYVM
jgi:hypothetical protein